MELKLENGKYVSGEYQGLLSLEGIDEIRQRILMKLCVKKGAFLPLPEYGSRLYSLSAFRPSLRPATAKQFVIEALSDEKDLELTELLLFEQGEGEILLEMSFLWKGSLEFGLETRI